MAQRVSLCSSHAILLLHLFIQSKDFKAIGTLVGMSLVQGGDGYPFFAPSIYEYIQGKDICEIIPGLDEVPDSTLRATLVKVVLYLSFVGSAM